MSRMIIGSGNFKYEFDPSWSEIEDSLDLVEVCGIAVDSLDRVYLFNRGPDPVIVLSNEGRYVTSWGKDLFSRPHGIYVDKNDAVYCTDVGNHTVRKFTPNGELLMTLGEKDSPSETGCQGRDYRTIKTAAGPFNAPTGVVVSDKEEIFVSDGYGNARIHKFSADGALLSSWGNPGDGMGEFNLPHAVAVSKDKTIYVADRENNRIQVMSYEGIFIRQWKDIYRPTDIFIDEDEYIYVAELGHQVGITMGMSLPTKDSPHSCVSIYDPDGELVCKLGDGEYRRLGNFYAAHAVCVDSRRNLYIGEVIWAVSKGNPPAGTRVLQKLCRT